MGRKKKEVVEEINIDASAAIEEMKKAEEVKEEAAEVKTEEPAVEKEADAPVKEEKAAEEPAKVEVVEVKPEPTVKAAAPKKTISKPSRRRLTSYEAYGRYAFGVIYD